VDSATLVRALQERAARAQPAEHVELFDGWWLRHAPGCDWWINSVLPHGGAPESLPTRIAQAEAFYARRGMTARFQITPGACAAELDALLEDSGYHRRSPVLLEVAGTERVRAQTATRAAARVEQTPSGEWLGVWHTVHDGDADAKRALLGRVALPAAYAAVERAGKVVAVGRAVCDAGWAGVFAMATLPSARRDGAGDEVLAGLADWAAAHGAGRMYLQVEESNLVARHLYEAKGFAAIVCYHYWEPGPPVAP